MAAPGAPAKRAATSPTYASTNDMRLAFADARTHLWLARVDGLRDRH